MGIEEWLPLLDPEFRRWIESHPFAPLAEPVLKEIAQVGGPDRDDPHWTRKSSWGDAKWPNPRFLSTEDIHWVLSLPDRHLDPDEGKPHPSAKYFRNQGRWYRGRS